MLHRYTALIVAASFAVATPAYSQSSDETMASLQPVHQSAITTQSIARRNLPTIPAGARVYVILKEWNNRQGAWTYRVQWGPNGETLLYLDVPESALSFGALI